MTNNRPPIISTILLVLVTCLLLATQPATGAPATQLPDHYFTSIQESAEWVILVDDFEPQPLQGQGFWPHNRLGGDRGRIDGPGGGEVVFGRGVVTATITGGTDTWMGLWTSLNHPIIDCTPLDFSAVLSSAIDTQYQGRVTSLRFHVLDGQGDLQVELLVGENTHCPPQMPVPGWPGATASLNGGEQVITFVLPSDLGNVQSLNWLVRGGAGDYVVIDRIEMEVTLPHLNSPAERAFLYSYTMLLNNWDPISGLSRDHAYWSTGGFDNVPASGMQAVAAVMAWRLGFISETSATEIVTKTTEALVALPRDMCGGNLWPHFIRDGDIVPGTEWSSIDTVIAAIALIQARAALNLDTTEVEAVLTGINWANLILTDGHISHGYWSDCQPIEPGGTGGWQDFGTESWLVNFAYAAATGNVADFDHTPPTHNGSGFIDELAWLLLPAPCQDHSGTEWNDYRSEAVDSQLAYYEDHPCYGGPPRLFGLSAAEVPDLSAVPVNQIYQAYGVGGAIAPNDGTNLLGHAVVIPHYAGLAASLRSDEATALWEWLEEYRLFTPLNAVESLMIVDEPACEQIIWNGMKGSWNLSLQTLGWGRLLAGENNPLYAALWSNDMLRQGYQALGTQHCQLDVVINEIAWMGTTTASTHEWIELYNNTDATIDLTGWTLQAADGTPTITLVGSIPPYSHYLLERSSDNTVPGVPADRIYTGALGDEGEDLHLYDATATLIDRVDASAGWFSGHRDGRVPMMRVDTTLSGSEATNWTYNPRCGSPTNSAGISHTCTLTTTTTGVDLDYAVYFNERATTASSTTLEQTTIEAALLQVISNTTATLDVALYGLDRQSVVNALITAHNRGVAVRVVGDDDASQEAGYITSYQALRDAGITIVTDASGDIQHNKFVVSDEQVIWTGSTNLTDNCLTLNANNSIVITSTTLAEVYTIEFEEMWGGAFHRAKTDNTPHLLDYNGTLVESYFSPTDLVAFEVWDELAETTESLHFAMFFWTDDMLADRVIERLADGVAVYGVWDQTGAPHPYSVYEPLCDAGAHVAVENFPGKVHHKFAVLDVFGAHPRVILGSYNWTGAGAYSNDENTLIIHDRTLAEAYYEEWLTLWQAIPPHRICNPLGVDKVEINGPLTGTVGQSYTFTATVNAVATPPVTYTWAATGQTPVVHSGQGLTDTVAFTWSTAGLQTITVTAQNAWGQAVDTHWVTMTLPPPSPVLTVTLTGPMTGSVETVYTFLATVNPTATLPLTYTWEATGQTPVVHSGQGLTDTVAFTWSTEGLQTITVTAQNAWGQAMDTHWVTLTLPPPPPVLTVILTGPVTGTVDTAYTFLATVNPTATLPLTYTWEATGQTPVVRSGLGLTDTVAWTWVVPGPQTLTVTVQNAEGFAVDTHAFAVEVAPEEVTITGPVTGTVDTAYTFLATVNSTATLPLTYTWEATGQTPVVHSGQGLTDTVSFAWPMTGTQTITVTAQNAWGQAVSTHWVTLTLPPPPTLEVSISGPLTGAVDTAYTFLATVNSTLFLPLTYTWEASGQMPVVHPGQGLTDTVTFTWSATGAQVITVTVANATATAWDTHTLILTLSDYFVYLPMVARDFSTSAPADVQITYIEYDPPGDDVQGEYVQIENLGGAAQEMTDWTLRDEANRVFTFPVFTLPVGGTVRVWTKASANTVTDLYWGSGTAIWNNTGDTAYLRDAGGALISSYTYP